MKTTIDFIVLR